MPQKQTSLFRFWFILKVDWGLQEDEIPFLLWLDRAKECTEGASNENEVFNTGLGMVLAGSLNSIRASPGEQHSSEGEESCAYGDWGETRGVQAEALECGEATKRRFEPT